MGRFVFLVIGFSIFVALIAPSTPRGTKPDRPVTMVNAGGSDAAAVSTTSSSSSLTGSGGEVTIEREPGGRFHANASVNGQSLPFVVDTGADTVALTVDDARRIGLYVDPTTFTVIGEGASGAVRGKEFTLDRVEIAGRTVHNVRAAVLEGLGQNLLGQTVLAELGGVEMKGDRMVLR